MAETSTEIPPTDIDAYVTDRVQHQISYFNSAAKRDQGRGKQWQNLVIVATALTPLLIGLAELAELGTTQSALRGAALVSSFAAVLGSTLLGARRYWENGVLYRAREQALIRERFLWEQGIGPYHPRGPQADRQFIANIEALIEEDVTGWTGRMQEASKRTKT